jgi:hypothetical protein
MIGRWKLLVAVSFAILAVGAVAGRYAFRAAAWSDAKTWVAGVPVAGSSVHIARGQTVILDVQPPKLKKLVIDGRLIVADRDMRIEADEIDVTGALEIGSERHRFAHNAQVVLDGASAGTGTIAISNGGRVDLWGKKSVAWTHLSQTVAAGASELVLDAAVDWQPGDRIAIAPSGYDAREVEERMIVARDGVHVRLDTPLRYRHWGTQTDGVDERAEIGLLTHNITITSDAQAAVSEIGGQVMIMGGGRLRASGVAFSGLGKRGKLGQYPVHFHLAGDANGSLVEASSISHSHNRCLTIHGTSNVLVRDNVAFDTIGHCYFLEDGVEMGNTFERNLGMLTRAADPKYAVLETDLLPATFWISNPANTVRGNVAAGSQGTGFWYSLSPHPTGPSATVSIWPRRAALGEFSANVTHTNEMNGLFVDILHNPPGVTEAPNYNPPVIADFKTLTTYKNRRRGAWLRGTKLRLTQAVVADNSIGVTFAGADAVLQDSLVVGETGNQTGPPKPFEADFPIRGFEFYDGQVGVARTRFANFTSTAARRASALGTLQYSPFFTDPSNFAQGLTFDRAEPVYFAKHPGAKDKLGADGYRGTAFVDRDGSVTGMPGAMVVLDTPMLADRDCTRHASWNALVCNATYASLFVVGVDAGMHSPGPVRIARMDNAAYLTLYGNPTPGKDSTYQTNVRDTRSYAVTFAKGFPLHVRIGLHNLPQGRGLTLVFPQAPKGVRILDGGKIANGIHGRGEREPLKIDLTSDAGRKQVLDLCSDPHCT